MAREPLTHRSILLIAVVATFALVLFVIDVSLPAGLPLRLPYVAVVALSLWLQDRRWVFATATGCTLLLIAGLAFSPGSESRLMDLVNRLVSAVAFWLVAIVGVAVQRTVELERANQALKREMEQRERLEAQLLRSQRLESIGVLAGGIAHDFNNLMTPILMAAKLLKEDRPPEETRELLTTLQTSAERGAEIVRQLLAFAGGIDGVRSAVSVQTVIDEIRGIVSHTFPKTIRLTVDVAGPLRPVIADATQLAQVLLNLCVNARDAMPQGGTLTISARNGRLEDLSARVGFTDKTGPCVIATVSDTGVGIPEDVLDRVFDPFFTTKGVGKGTGLGLATAVGIVRGHGGWMDVESKVGRGSRFTIILPASTEAVAAPAPAVVNGRPPRGEGELILVVDDEPAILQTASSTLVDHGFRVMTASDGNEALDRCRGDGAIRAVVLDMMMPQRDGAATLAALDEMNLRVPVIASSGLKIASAVTEAIARRGGAILPKPYSAEQLLQTVDRVLRPATSRGTSRANSLANSHTKSPANSAARKDT